MDLCNIWIPKCEPLTIARAEKWCPNCKGWGAAVVHISFKQGRALITRCYVCEGKGTVDWITAVVQRAANFPSSPLKNSKEVKLKCPGHLRCKKKLKRLWQKTNI